MIGFPGDDLYAHIERVSAAEATHSSELVSVQLSNRRILRISASPTLDLPRLVMLNLNFNHIASLEGLHYQSFPSLKQLFLRGNRIDALAALEALASAAPALQELDLRENPIAHARSKQYRDLVSRVLPSLQVLDGVDGTASPSTPSIQLPKPAPAPQPAPAPPSVSALSAAMDSPYAKIGRTARAHSRSKHARGRVMQRTASSSRCTAAERAHARRMSRARDLREDDNSTTSNRSTSRSPSLERARTRRLSRARDLRVDDRKTSINRGTSCSPPTRDFHSPRQSEVDMLAKCHPKNTNSSGRSRSPSRVFCSHSMLSTNPLERFQGPGCLHDAKVLDSRSRALQAQYDVTNKHTNRRQTACDAVTKSDFQMSAAYDVKSPATIMEMHNSQSSPSVATVSMSHIVDLDEEQPTVAKHEMEAAVDVCMIELATALLSSKSTSAANLALISKPETRERFRIALGANIDGN